MTLCLGGLNALASELIQKLQTLIDEHGDKPIVVAGVFHGGIHTDISVFPPTEYYDPASIVAGDFALFTNTDVGDNFIIDEV